MTYGMAPPPGCPAGSSHPEQPRFDTNSPTSPEALRKFRETIVLRTYLKQQLLAAKRSAAAAS